MLSVTSSNFAKLALMDKQSASSKKLNEPNSSRNKKLKILVLNGPNLNLLGTREPEIYGYDTLEQIAERLVAQAGDTAELDFQQSNSEGELVNLVQGAKSTGVDFIIINPAAFTHTSRAIPDALVAVSIPFLEVHLSNIFAREEFRRHSCFSATAKGVIAGLGVQGYELALAYALTQFGG